MLIYMNQVSLNSCWMRDFGSRTKHFNFPQIVFIKDRIDRSRLLGTSYRNKDTVTTLRIWNRISRSILLELNTLLSWASICSLLKITCAISTTFLSSSYNRARMELMMRFTSEDKWQRPFARGLIDIALKSSGIVIINLWKTICEGSIFLIDHTH